MPNRIIKESICTSDTLSGLNDFQENFFFRLIVSVDDFGRLDARPSILKAKLYPLRDRLTLRDVESALRALADAGCVEVYEVDGKPYLRLPTWEVHQRVRNKRSKYPAPGDGNPLTIDSKSQANAAVIQSNPNPNPNPESEDSAEHASGSPPVILLPLNDGTDYAVTEEQCQEWAGLYPAVDVIQQLREMRGWLNSNPTKRKTIRGIQSFVTRWLAKEQDRGYMPRGRSYTPPVPCAPGDGDKKAAQDMERMRRFLSEGR